MRVCQFRHFGVARLPNGTAKAYTVNYFTGVNGRCANLVANASCRQDKKGAAEPRPSHHCAINVHRTVRLMVADLVIVPDAA